MKYVWMWSSILIMSLQLSFAHTNSNLPLATIESIDDYDLLHGYNDASDICLPEENFLFDNFTVLTDARVRELFIKLERDSNARNQVAGGKCSYRRVYIQKYLKRLGIVSGKLYLECPSKNGRMRLIDQVTGRRYTFSNFHDTNIVSSTSGYQVMDVQFLDRPVTLSSYLAQIETSQKLKPLSNRSSGDKGFCYWSIQ